MIPKRPDLGYILRLLSDVLKEIDSIGAYLILAKTMQELVLIEKGDARESQIETLAMDGAERLYINLEFWNKHLRTEEAVKFVLMHELMHHVLGDTAILRKREKNKIKIIDDLEGIATDARINALLTALLDSRGEGKSFPEVFYEPTGLPGLLRPNSDAKIDKEFKLLYTQIYSYDEGMKGYEDILATLKLILANRVQKINIILIGGHGTGEGEDGVEALKDMPKEIRDALIGALLEGGKMGGIGGAAGEMFIKLLKNQRQIDRKLFAAYSTTHKINMIRSYWRQKRKSKKPVPISPSRRDIARMVITGQMPVMWSVSKTRQSKKEVGVAIYLDVSGSVQSYLPKIIRMIVSMKREIELVYGFSTEVKDHTMSDLKRGKIDTTGGTDFDCVAKHILEKEYSKCIIITDGYASMSSENSAKVEKQLKKCGTILFDKGSCDKNNWFSKRFDTYYLDEIVK